ncbi:MAG TPA: sugar phosphate isomerase/epimerase [Acidobacteriaceae bacterium]|nr:sugar phosphate isomerase/epimerase [Acidobacteriaceae bacterium]
MLLSSRRDFLKTGAAALTCTAALGAGNFLHAESLGLPLGLQLYSVREQLQQDYAGTLKQIAALGYREVEAAGFFHYSPAQVLQAMQGAGLHCVGALYSLNDLQQQFDSILAFGKALGLRYIICSFPGLKNPARLKDTSFRAQVLAFNLEDWRWNAEQFNQMGAKVKAAGMQFGYHNYTMGFQAQDGVVPYEELLRLTDPDTVTMEMDCGWVHFGGGVPIEYLRRYPTRISLLHVKDFKRTNRPVTIADPPPAAELGQGTMDNGPIFAAAAKTGQIRHCFAEQEGFDMPPMQSLKIDAEYLRHFKV